MKTKNFYTLDDKKEKKLFENAIFFFDTSSLLDFYYFTNDNINEISNKLFEPLKDRLWITSQTEYEFLKNNEKVKLKPIEAYNSLLKKNKNNNDSGHLEEIENVINSIKSKVSDELRGHLKTLKEKVHINNKHPYLDGLDFSIFNKQVHDLEKNLDSFKSEFETFKNMLFKKVEAQKELIINNSNNDTILEKLNNYFKVSEELSYDEIIKIIKEGKFRYENQIPPGYMDREKKIGFQIYGDLIVWKQLLKVCKKLKKDAILVINDVKEDWWYLDDKKKHISPRYELIKEFEDYCGKNIWMYDITNFLYKSNLHISASINEATIDEIKHITKEIQNEELEIQFIDWIFNYFDIQSLEYNFPENIYDIITYNGENSNKIIYKKINSKNYTKLMLPIRDFLDFNDNIENTADVLILEYNDAEIASTFDKHMSGKRTLRGLISQINNNKKRIIALMNNNNESYSVLYDSNQ